MKVLPLHCKRFDLIIRVRKMAVPSPIGDVKIVSLISTFSLRDCAIIIRRGGGAEKLELSSKNLDSTHPPKQKKLVLAPPLLC